MAALRRLRLLFAAAAVTTVVVVAIHASEATPAPGHYISWSPPAAATASPTTGSAISVATAPAATSSVGPLGALTLPLSGLFQQLNANTAQTATGEYSILQALEGALATHIEDFLNWVAARH